MRRGDTCEVRAFSQGERTVENPAGNEPCEGTWLDGSQKHAVRGRADACCQWRGGGCDKGYGHDSA